jgi:predicted amidophosphoribosyltransferase
VTIKVCEACGAPIYDAEPNALLCDLCAKTIDAQTELLLEMQHFEPGFDELWDE